MTTKEICDRWMHYVYEEWLDGWIRKDQPSYLHESTKNMVNRMKTAAKSERTEEAWNLLEQLKRLNEGFDSEVRVEKYKYEKPESYMECALTAYSLGDIRDALEFFHVAIGYFPNSVYKAVCYWMAGCVQWQLPSRSESAVLSWERSLQMMSEFGSDKLDYITDSTLKQKYNQTIDDMRAAINNATRDGYPHPPPKATDTRNKSAFSTAYSARLAFLPYYGSIPAGDPVTALEHSDGLIGMDLLEIEGGRFYNIFNIRKEKEIRLHSGEQYFLMKASGESMNIAKPIAIENHDYVLLRNVTYAQNNDIVAAVVFGRGEPETATLKRYHEDSSGRFIMSESDKETINIRMSGSDYIQGVLVAILKPADD